jgi:HNH endonuclease
MDRELEDLVWERAHSRCEYCLMPQEYDAFTHEIDHVIAKKHGGPTVAGNLVLACFPCNNHKGPNIAGLDPLTHKLTPLFKPRRHRWERHFRWAGPELVGRTAIGRVTIAVLEINSPERVLLRRSLIDEGVFPPAAS